MSTISERQNEKKHIEQLMAQRCLYNKVRFINMVRIIGLIAVNSIWVIFSTLKWHSEFIVVCGTGIIILFEFLLKEFWQEPIQKKAALVQELFDCDVLELKWKDHINDIRPSVVEISLWATRYDEKKYSKASLKDWYSNDVDSIPLEYGRLCCIYSNIDWDISLRIIYLRHLLLWFVGCIIIFFVVIALWGIAEVNKLWILIACTLPILRLGWDAITGNVKSIKNLKFIREMMDRKWNAILKGKLEKQELEEAARDWQKEILQHRMISPVLPEKYYMKNRPKHENEMNRSSGVRANEIKENLFPKL